ncbi:hypothetical protein PAMP_001291 [Pampus punctatissimus]
MNQSDVDYIPDSEVQDDSDYEDSDTSKPFMTIQSNNGQIQVQLVIPDAGTSYGLDTGIPVVSSTSKGQPPLEETSGSANSIKISPKKKKKTLEDQAEPHNQESTHLTMSTKKLLLHLWALMAEHEELIKSTDTNKKLYSSKWSELVSHSALNTPSDAKYNKPTTLPFTEDVHILHQCLEKSAETAFCNLKENAMTQNYAQLAKLTLAQIILFN